MKNFWDIEVHVGRRSDGKWIAATDSSPYFYLEADSETAVEEAAKLAIFTYRDATPILENITQGGRQQTISFTYSREKTIRGKELVHA